MEINSQAVSSQPNPQINPNTPPPVNEKELQAEESGLTTDSTVNISAEAQGSGNDSNTVPQTEINSSEQAQQSATQFQEDAANDPVLAQNAQSSNLTSEQVKRLIG